jgi:hypothetical protein
MLTTLTHTAETTGLAFDLAGQRVRALACGGLWWEEPGVLVVSDLHFEKASSYAARGQMLPPYDTRATLARVGRLIESLAPRTVISLGDSFHDRRARPRMAADDVASLRRMTGSCDWVWIKGNHDPKPPEDLGGPCRGRDCRAPASVRARGGTQRAVGAQALLCDGRDASGDAGVWRVDGWAQRARHSVCVCLPGRPARGRHRARRRLSRRAGQSGAGRRPSGDA